jgi:hypothetical protein
MMEFLNNVYILAISVISGLSAATGMGAALGAFSAWLGWSDTPGTPFDPKKFAKGIVTGAIAGIVTVSLSFDAIQTAIEGDATGVQFFKLLVVIAVSIVGADVITSKVGGMIQTFFGSSKSTS